MTSSAIAQVGGGTAAAVGLGSGTGASAAVGAGAAGTAAGGGGEMVYDLAHIAYDDPAVSYDQYLLEGGTIAATVAGSGGASATVGSP